MSIYDYVFKPIEDSGKALPGSRFDILLSIVLAVALMAALAYSADPSSGWTTKRAVLVAGAALLAISFAQHRRVVFGCATGVIAGRLLFGLLLGIHPLEMALGAIACGTVSWWLLKSCR